MRHPLPHSASRHATPIGARLRTALRRARLLVLAAVALAAGAVTPRGAHAQCPYAPAFAKCRYVDPELAKSLSSIAQSEALRWAIQETMLPVIQTVAGLLQRTTHAVAQYDSALQALATPPSELQGVLTAAVSLTDPSHPSPALGVRAEDRLTQLGAAPGAPGTPADSTHPDTDPVRHLANEVGVLEAAVHHLMPGTRDLAHQLSGDYDAAGATAAAGINTATLSRTLAARVRGGAHGMDGESEAAILAAKSRVDALRGFALDERVGALGADLSAVRAGQAARSAQVRALSSILHPGQP